MKKQLALTLLVCVLAVPLSGCGGSGGKTGETADIELPQADTSIFEAVCGEKIESRRRKVTLYDTPSDGLAASSIDRVILVPYGTSVSYIVSETFLESYCGSGNSTVKVISTEECNGLITVDLSAATITEYQDRDLYFLVSELGSTLLSLTTIDAVNILIDGRAISFAGLPMGTMTEATTAIAAGYAQYDAEKEYLASNASGTVTRTAFVYYPAEDAGCLVPVARSVSFSRDNICEALMALLEETPDGLDTCAALPDGFVSDARIISADDGSRVLELIPGRECAELKIEAAALTALSFIPDLDAVAISGKRYTRDSLSPKIGSAVPVWVTGSGTSLHRTLRAIPSVQANSCLGVLKSLFSDGLTDFFTAEDILGVSVESGIACANLSADAYRKAQALPEDEERNVIYAVVNTLCEFEDIDGVCFRVDSQTAMTLSGNIALDTILMYNPGPEGLKEDTIDNETDSIGQ